MPLARQGTFGSGQIRPSLLRILDDPSGGLDQAVGGEVREDGDAATAAGTGGNEDGAASNGATGFDIRGAVTDEKRTRKVYIVVAGGLAQEECSRLTAEAAIVWVVRAVVDGINLGALR